MLQVQTFTGTVLATVVASVNTFLSTKDFRRIIAINSDTFQRGGLTQFTYTIVYYP